MEDLQCLILTPPLFESDRLREELEPALLSKGINLVRSDDWIPYGAPASLVSDTIRRQIETAHLIIADLTGANPNVMYQVGYAHALKKPVLPLIKEGEGQIPSVLSGYLYYVYDPFFLPPLKNVVLSWVERTGSSNIKG